MILHQLNENNDMLIFNSNTRWWTEIKKKKQIY